MSTTPRIPLDPAQLARPLRVAAAILTLTSVTRAVMQYVGDAVPSSVMIVRAVQIGVLIGIAAAGSAQRSPATLLRLGFALALTVPLANLVVNAIDPRDVWGTVTVLVAITLGAALFAPWSWRWQAALAGTLAVAAMLTLVLAVPRTVFALTDVVFAIFLILAAGAASVGGTHLADRERHRVLASEARYRALFENAGEAIALLDEQGVVRQANAALASLLDRPRDAVVGRRLGDFQERRPESAVGEAGVTAEHTAALRGELRRSTHTLVRGDSRPIEVSVTYARAGEGAGAPVQAIIQDLTERRALERHEIKDQRLDALGQLAGGIAHQFNNILGGILTHAGVLREDSANAASAAELDEILGAARRGRALTQELLRFTRSEPLSLKPTAPRTLLDGVAALARTSLPDSVTVEVHAAPDLPGLLADVDHLTHACLELVFNARDAMRGAESGRLILSADVEDVTAGDGRWPSLAPGRYGHVAVRDNGRGMDAATQRRVFEPFFTTKPMHQAAGIGLAKVYGVVRDHQGSVRLESAPGRGTTVHLLLPLAAQPAPAPPPPPVAAGPRTILIVDDEAIVRHSLRRALTRFGYRVVEAEDGPTALAALQTADPPVTLVILDLVLPGGGAGILELLRAVRPDLKVLVSSGYSPEADTVQDLVRRTDGFLPKPYEMSELRAAVAKALGTAS
jgi:PAS domain S-box-containing protein